MKLFPLFSAAGLTTLLAVSPVFAHALLQSAVPPVGGTVSAPTEIRITYSEGIEPLFSGITLSGPDGAVPVGPATTAPGDDKVMVIRIGQNLKPGSYTVSWHAVSVDTHHTKGSFDFTVK